MLDCRTSSLLLSRKLQSNRLLAASQNPLKKDETEEVSVSPAAAKEISMDVATATVLSAMAGIFKIKEAQLTTHSRYSMDGGEKKQEGGVGGFTCS